MNSHEFTGNTEITGILKVQIADVQLCRILWTQLYRVLTGSFSFLPSKTCSAFAFNSFVPPLKMYGMDHQGSSCLAILCSDASLMYVYASCSLQRLFFFSFSFSFIYLFFLKYTAIWVQVNNGRFWAFLPVPGWLLQVVVATLCQCVT